jgi:hypothetical protein
MADSVINFRVVFRFEFDLKLVFVILSYDVDVKTKVCNFKTKVI